MVSHWQRDSHRGLRGTGAGLWRRGGELLSQMLWLFLYGINCPLVTWQRWNVSGPDIEVLIHCAVAGQSACWIRRLFCSKSACPRLMNGRASSGRWPRSTRTETKPRNWPTSDGTKPTVNRPRVLQHTTIDTGFLLFPPCTTRTWPEEICRAGSDRENSFRQVFRCLLICVLEAF